MSEKRETATFALAVIRTELANSRALISHIQAAIALVISAIAFMNLFQYSLFLYICCWLFIIFAIVLFVRGIYLYRTTNRRIDEQKRSVNGS